MDKEEILKQIENNNNIIFKLQNTNKTKCLNLLFDNEILSVRLKELLGGL